MPGFFHEIAMPPTTMNFTGLALPLADTDLPRYGSLIGAGEDEVHAFLEVETNGHGFDTQRRPKMLFEPHKFWAALSGDARDAAVRHGVAYLKQGTRPYPVDSYPSLKIAMGIDQDAALKSASWGLGQVLGGNFALAGYPDVLTFVRAMMGGEAQQLAAAILFVKSAHLDDELRAHNWPAFARGYNGPNYAKFGYADKLAAAFAKWSKVKDTPYPVAASATMAEALRTPGAHPTADKSDEPVRDVSTSHGVGWLQSSLNRLGAEPPLRVDGVMGPNTKAELYAWQAKSNLVANGVVSPTTTAAIERSLAKLA